MLDVHLSKIGSLDQEKDEVVVYTTFGKKEFRISQVKKEVKYELPKYKSALEYQDEYDTCYMFLDGNGKRVFSVLDGELTQKLINILHSKN